MIDTHANIQQPVTTIEVEGLDATDSGVGDAVGSVATSVIKGISKGIHRTIGDTPETIARIEHVCRELNLVRQNNIDLFAQVTAAQSTNSALIATNMQLVEANINILEKYHRLLAENVELRTKTLSLSATATLKRK